MLLVYLRRYCDKLETRLILNFDKALRHKNYQAMREHGESARRARPGRAHSEDDASDWQLGAVQARPIAAGEGDRAARLVPGQRRP